MARAAREKSKTGMYNVILKGVVDIFKDEEDYKEFIEKLEASSAEVLALGLIKKYAFLCVKESEKGISSDFKSFVIGYSRYYNKKYELDGKLFSDRFKSEPINSDDELKNSISLVQSVTAITGEDAHVSDYEMSDYTMIEFYASAMGVAKPESKEQKKAAEKKPVKKAEPKKATEKKPSKKAEPKKLEEKKPTIKAEPKKDIKAPIENIEPQKPIEVAKEEKAPKKNYNRSLPYWLM